MHALRKEICLCAEDLPQRNYDTVFFGGGTPSALPLGEISTILRELRANFTIAQDAEITIECNPGTLNETKLEEYIASGVNRLSLGLQSADDALLNRLGRIHTQADFLANYELARKAGFENINADIMYGLTGQGVNEHLDTIKLLHRLGVEHISAYSLIVEESTPLYMDVIGGGEFLPDEDTAYNMHREGIALLQKLGYMRYEISNFAKEGFESRHNLNYWNYGEYLGIGLGAHSTMQFDNKLSRFSNLISFEEYITSCNEGVKPVAAIKKIEADDAMFEFVMLGLRKTAGFDMQEFKARFNVDFEAALGQAADEAEAKGWLIRSEQAVRLSEEGLDMQNEVLMLFM